jgi:hypothetical protein
MTFSATGTAPTVAVGAVLNPERLVNPTPEDAGFRGLLTSVIVSAVLATLLFGVRCLSKATITQSWQLEDCSWTPLPRFTELAHARPQPC